MNIFSFEWTGIFSFTMSPLELMLRGLVCGLVGGLARDGQRLRRDMRRELITNEELNAKIRQEGVEDIATVERMYLEANGGMSLIRRDKPRART